MIKQLHTKKSLLILVDSCQVDYQILLIICLKLIIKIAKSECEFIGFKSKRLNYRCKECNGISTKSINEIIEKFPRIYQFCNGDLNKFVLLLRKSGYPYEYMDSWERFNETWLPPKKDFYSELALEGITNKDYNHAQKVFEIYCTDIGDYHDLYVQTDTLLLADVLKNLEINALKYIELILLIFYLYLD